jgi:hypothetical protein
MEMTRLKFAIGMLTLFLGAQVLRAWAQTPPAGIAPAQFDNLRALIKPKPGGFDDLPWMTDLWEARKKAADEGKPLLVWVGDGHPLGWT